MQRILCLVGGEWNADLEAKLLPYDDDEHEIHLFDHICDGEVDPDDVLGLLENLSIEDKEEIPCLFMSDIPNLYSLVKGLYPNIFYGFEWLESDDSRDCLFTDEELYQEMLSYFESCNAESDEKAFTKEYIFKGNSHIFEPVYGEIKTISLDGTKAEGRWVYHYPFLQPQMEQLQEWLQNEDYTKCMNAIETMFEQIDEQRKQVGIFQFYMFLIALRNKVLSCTSMEQCLFVLHGLSFLVKMTSDEKTFNLFMAMVLSLKDALPGEHFYFVTNQIRRLHFETPSLCGDGRLSAAIYQEAYTYFEKQLKALLSPIGKEERNKDVILVLNPQFLSDKHAPTRTALERIYTLGKEMNKKVYVLNTRERGSRKGELPMYNFFIGNVVEEYSALKEMTWKDYTFDFYQPACEMPDVEEMRKLLKWIREMKPYEIMTIGGGSLFSDLCTNVIPVLEVPIVFSSIPKTDKQIAVIGQYLTDEKKEGLVKAGYDLDRVVESTFTFDMKPQTITLTREQLGLPEDKFLMAVVGTRLDIDVSDEFLREIKRTLPYKTHLVFAGFFENYERRCEEVPWLKEHSTNAGYQSDIMAFMENIDLYVNPKRLGGGFSIIEAFSKGRPGVTISYGDVATAAGKEFCVADYDEMIETIKRYTEDKEFYQSQVEKGKLRAVKMTDSKAALEEILAEAESRKAFF